MNNDRSIQAAMWTLILVQTVGAVDLPGSGARKLPAPRTYVPVIVGYTILSIVADAGADRAAKIMAWLLVLAAAVLGPFGLRAANFLSSVGTNFAPPPITGK